MPVILATHEAEIRRIVVQSQPRQIVCEILSRKNPQKKRAGGMTQSVGPEFKPLQQKKETSLTYSSLGRSIQWFPCNDKQAVILRPLGL
jgi:hypothetical protein